jgi:hypothetical protein
MKLKGVNPLEQHIEKIVLIVVSAIFLIVLSLQFLVEPNKVKVTGSTQAVPPGKAFDSVEAKAKQLKTVMEQTDLGNALPAAPKYDLVRQLKDIREKPVIANASCRWARACRWESRQPVSPRIKASSRSIPLRCPCRPTSRPRPTARPSVPPSP